MNKDNLLKLATYLLSDKLEARFDMSVFDDRGHINTSSFFTLRPNTCGTVGCAIGHGPYAGIEKLNVEDWQAYAHRVFQVDVLGIQYNWMFSSLWADVDNSPEGAAKRILYILKKGIPDNVVGQIYGLIEPCYLNEEL